MSYLKTANTSDKYRDLNTRKDLLNYILDSNKTPDGYVGFILTDPADPAGSMDAVAAGYGKTNGVQIRHLILSFAPWELTSPAIAAAVANDIACYLGQQYQTVWAVHQDTPHLHIHIAFNPVSMIDGTRYRGLHSVWREQMKAIGDICHRHGLSRPKYSSH